MLFFIFVLVISLSQIYTTVTCFSNAATLKIKLHSNHSMKCIVAQYYASIANLDYRRNPTSSSPAPFRILDMCRFHFSNPMATIRISQTTKMSQKWVCHPGSLISNPATMSMACMVKRLCAVSYS